MPLGLFFLPSLSHPSSYVLGCSLGMCHPLLSLRKKGYAEAVARAIPPQPVLVLPPALESLATELFLFDPQHRTKGGHTCLRDIKIACQEATHSMTSNKQKLLLFA